jgi:hypothetical protein
MTRDHRLLFTLLWGGGFLLLLFTVGPLAGGRCRPTDLQRAPIDNAPAVSCPTCPAGRAPLAEAGAVAADEVQDLAKLTPAQAAELDGKDAVFRVVITSASGNFDRGKDRREVYEMLPADDPQGTLWLLWRDAAHDLEGDHVVRATLHVIHREGLTTDKLTVKAYTEYRLVDAVLGEAMKQPDGPRALARADQLPAQYWQLDLSGKQVEAIRKVRAAYRGKIEESQLQIDALRAAEESNTESCLTDAQKNALHKAGADKDKPAGPAQEDKPSPKERR